MSRRNQRVQNFFAGTLAVLSAISAASAGVVYDEGVSGDISNNRLVPTGRTLSIGSNTLTATSAGADREYITLVVPTGAQLTQVNVLSYQSASSQSFVGVQAGTTVTVDPSAPTAGPLLGYTHFGAFSVGTNILPGIGTGAGAIGFAPPLGAGNYTWWIQETSSSLTTYTFDFVVVPAPGVGGLVCGVGLMLARRRRAGM